MRLSKANYYADIVIYPMIVTALAVAEFSSISAAVPYHWLATCGVGLMSWTLIEYIIHRFVFHVVPPALQMHLDHHAEPGATIGTPIWLSAAAFALGGFLPIWSYSGFETASGGLAGLLLGYIWYVVVHHAVHHWRIEPTSWLYTAKLRHTTHHYRSDDCNFGVTTGFWDWMFGTAFDMRAAKTQQRG